MVEFLVGDNFHIEIFKRSTPILTFLSNNNGLTTTHLENIWAAGEGKHEATVRAVFDVITELTRFLNNEGVEFFYGKLYDIPLDKFDDITITLLQKMSLNVQARVAQQTSYTNILSNLGSKKPKLNINSKYEGFGVRLLFEAIQDKSLLGPKYITQAYNALLLLLKNDHFKMEREKYLAKSYDNLVSGTSMCQSLSLFITVLYTFPQTRYFKQDSSKGFQSKSTKLCLLSLSV